MVTLLHLTDFSVVIEILAYYTVFGVVEKKAIVNTFIRVVAITTVFITFAR